MNRRHGNPRSDGETMEQTPKSLNTEEEHQ